jgi:acetyl esterase/lipase
MQSLASRLVALAIVLRGSKRRFRSADLTRRQIAKLQLNPARFAPPQRLFRGLDVTVSTRSGWPVYEITTRGLDSRRRAIYLHGGAYVYEIVAQHWQLIADLARSTETRFIVPIYPLAPSATASAIVPAVADLAEQLIRDVGAENLSILGDSAGGGMALAVALQLRDRGAPALRATVLISPWLDISGTDPAIAVIAPRDPWLAVPGSHAAGEIYRGELPEDDPIVSPIHGDFAGLGPVTMFSGTRDILNADARRLLRLAGPAGLTVEYHEQPEMIHVYPLLPIPEAKTARAMIRAAITR